jgi:outer membrane protein assembly factor BamA
VKALVAVLLVIAIGLAAPDARAQSPGQAPAAAQLDPDAELDVADLWRMIRHKPAPPPGTPINDQKTARAIVPTFGSSPSAGFSVGIGASLARAFGPAETTHMSSMLASMSFSTKSQTSITAKFDAFSDGNRVHFAGDNRFQWTSQSTYGLGTSTPPDAGIGARFTHVRVFETALVELWPHVSAGAGVNFSSHTSIRPLDANTAWDSAPPDAYAEAHGFDPASQTSAGGSAAFEWNTRDNPINASNGWLAAATYRAFFKGLFGGDSTWQELLVDVRHFIPLGNRYRTLAFWLYSDSVVHGVAPYFDLPAIGMDTYGRTGRGYAEGRFRGTAMVYGEVEYRQPLRRDHLIGMVVFANTSTFSDRDSGERLGDSFAPAAGAGLRVLFSKRSRANLCVDYGVGRQSHGFYLALQEAF